MASIPRFTLLPIAVLLFQAPLFGSTPGHGPDDAGVPDTAGHAGHAACPFASSPAAAGELPKQVGQDAFAALTEMRGLLSADPATDWSQVDLDALREHLVDMNRVVLDAEVSVKPVPRGFEARVTGTGRTLDAIRRMVPAHARYADGRDGLKVAASILEDTERVERGVVITVTTAETSAVDRLRGLGFFGFLVAGDHHLPHHRAMALGAGHP